MLVKKMYGSWDDVDDYWLNNNLIDCSKIKKLKKNNLQYNFNNNNNVLPKRFINGTKYTNGSNINGTKYTNESNINGTKYTNESKYTHGSKITNREHFINTRNEKFTNTNESSENKKNIYR